MNWMMAVLASLAACGFFFGAWKNSQAAHYSDLLASERKLSADLLDTQHRNEALIKQLQSSIEELRKNLNALSTPQSILDHFNGLFPPTK
jgi:uncharacterized protein HemX